MIGPNDIDAQFRIGKGHPTAVFGTTREDPADVAKEAYSEYCHSS